MTMPKTILVIDDNPGIRTMLDATLTDAGYAVQTAENGAAALDLAERGLPDLILLDLRMPVMNGWEFARQFRTRWGRCTPIIVMTANISPARWAEEIEAEGCLPKPFDLDDLLESVARHIRADDHVAVS